MTNFLISGSWRETKPVGMHKSKHSKFLHHYNNKTLYVDLKIIDTESMHDVYISGSLAQSI